MILNLLITFIISCAFFTGLFWLAFTRGWINYNTRPPATIDAIARDMIIQLDDQSIKTIQWTVSPEGMLKFHPTVGRYLRNRYHLWDPKCPLTKQWHDDRAAGLTNHIIDGVDYHPQHPDAISSAVLKCIWERVHSVAPKD